MSSVASLGGYLLEIPGELLQSDLDTDGRRDKR